MSDKPADYGREVRDTVVKSGLTGVAATVLAVTAFSPAGFGGVIGESLASNFGTGDANAATAEDPYANLPPFPAPLSQAELEEIHDQLARTSASLELTRAATEARIEFIRSIAFTGDVLTLQPVRQAELLTDDDLRPRSEVIAPTPASTEAVEAEAVLTPADYTASGGDAEYRDRHLELAELVLAHANR